MAAPALRAPAVTLALSAGLAFPAARFTSTEANADANAATMPATDFASPQSPASWTRAPA